MISAPGVGSGLDINSIITDLMALERRPIGLLDNQVEQYRAQLSGIGQLKSSISTFQDAMNELADVSKFNIFTALTDDEESLTATATSAGAVGNYDIQIQQLAQNHKIASEAYSSLTDVPTTAQRTLNIELGGDSETAFAVDITGKTLSEIRAAINAADDNSGVTATLITEDTGTRLMLTSDGSGSANTISTTVLDENSNVQGSPFNMTLIKAAQDSVITIDGFTVTSESNIVDDALQGVSLELHEVTSGTVTLDLDRDVESISENLTAFIDSFNELVGSVDTLRLGLLSGDNSLLSVESRLRSVINAPASGASSQFSYLSEIGISTQKDGTLSVDTSEFEAALNDDFRGVANLFADSESGFATRLVAVAQDMLSDNGVVESRTDGLNSRIDNLDNRKDQIERRLITTEERLRRQYASLDVLLGSLNQTSNYLNQQLTQFAAL